MVLFLRGPGCFFKDAFTDGLFYEFREVAFAAAVLCQVLAEGFVGFGGDYEVPADGVGGHFFFCVPVCFSIQICGYADKHPTLDARSVLVEFLSYSDSGEGSYGTRGSNPHPT